MSETMIRELGEHYAQERPEVLQKGQGSGLGIAFVKRMIALHGGTLDVTSNLGEGSTFTWTIPFKRVSSSISSDSEKSRNDKIITTRSQTNENIERIPKNPMKSSLSSQKYDLSDLEVLVVDDNDSNAKILSMLLKRMKVTVTCACDGEVAVDIIAKNVDRFKLIFMDNLMPKLTGPEATKIIRSRFEFRHLIIGATGNVSKNDIIDFLNAGVDLVLPKPLSLKTVNSVLDYIKENGTSLAPSHKLAMTTNQKDDTTVLTTILCDGSITGSNEEYALLRLNP